MSTDRDTTRIVRSWLKTDEHEDAGPVLESVLELIDTTPQRRASWPVRRFSIMNSTVMRAGLVAAVVVGLALVGLNVFGNGVRIGGPTPSDTAATTSPSPSPSAVARFPADGGGMEPGTYLISDPFPVDIELTLVEDWIPWTPSVAGDVAAIYQGSPDPPAGQVIVFAVVGTVYADPCDANAGVRDPGPTVADLAAELAGQPNTESTEPVEVTISGYSGVYIDYTAVGRCGSLSRWPSTFGDREALAGERDQVWILDVDGVRLVIDAASFAGTSESDLAEMRTLIESLTITP